MKISQANKKIIQRGFKAAGYYTGVIDGIWGNGTKAAIKHLQRELRGLGLYWKKIDGDYGWGTFQAVKHFQALHAHHITGVFSEEDGSEISHRYTNTHERTGISDRPAKSLNALQKSFPQETRDQKAIRAFYGHVGRNQTRIKLPYKMQIAWAPSKHITKMTCHEKIADHLAAVWEDVYKVYGEDVHKNGLDQFGGTLNVRKMRGAGRYSLHSWGVADDIDPVHNRMKDKSPRFAHPDYNDYWNIVAKHGGYSLWVHKGYDTMHTQWAWR